MARALRVIAALGLGVVLAPPALAHHVMGGAVPSTFLEGLLSGLGHPVIGLDHLAFVIAIGAMAHLLGRVVLLPLMFVAGTVAGCAIHRAGYTLPWAELLVAATVALAALAVALRAKPPYLPALLAVAGLLHGYAYGESIVGAEATPLAAYMAGFALTQSAVAIGSALAFRAIVGRDLSREAGAMRLAGGALALVAAAAFVTAAWAG